MTNTHVNLYLTPEQLSACSRALTMAKSWAQGDVSVFLDMVMDGYLRDKNGDPLSLSQWSLLIEPSLTEYARLVVGSTPGVVADVYDPSVHPVARTAHSLLEAWALVKPSTNTSLSAWPIGTSLHKKDSDLFDLHFNEGNKVEMGLNTATVLAQCKVPTDLIKISIDTLMIHQFMSVLDIYSRVLMNQWENLSELTEDRWRSQADVDFDAVRNIVGAFKTPWTGFDMNASSGIYNSKLHSDATVVWNVQRAVRHWDAVHRLGYSRTSTSTDGPMGRGESWPLVDSNASATLECLPIGGGIIGRAGFFTAVENFDAIPNTKVLARSYSPVSLLDSLSYIQAHPGAPSHSF